MHSKGITITNKVGLHAKPLTVFVTETKKYKNANIWLEKEERRANAKSLLSVLSLGIVQNDNVKVLVDENSAAYEERFVNEIIDVINSLNKYD